MFGSEKPYEAMQNCRADSNYLGTIRRHANPWVVAVSACSVDAASSRMSKCQRWSSQKKNNHRLWFGMTIYIHGHKIYHQKNLTSKRCRCFMTKPLQLYKWPPPNATAAARMICEAKSGSSPCRVQDFNNPQKTGQWTCFCIEMFVFFLFSKNSTGFPCHFFLRNFQKRNQQPIKKKHPKKNPQNPQNPFTTSKVFTAMSCALVTSLFAKLSTEKFGRGKSTVEHVYIPSLEKVYQNPLKLQSKC